MLKTHIRLAVLVLPLAWGVISQGLSPNAARAQGGGQDKVESSQQKPAGDQARPADESPIVTLRILRPKQDSGEGASKNNECRQCISTDWWMFGATVGIGFIGLLQLVAFIVQAIYLAKSAKEMRKTTEASERVSRDQIAHAHQVERAYMSAGGVPERRIDRQFIGSLSAGEIRDTLVLTGRFEVHINNHGKTPGELMQIAIGFCDADNIPPEPVYDPQPFHDWIGPGTQSRAMDWREIPKGQPASAVYGRIYYRDIFERDQFSSFIQRIFPDGSSAPLQAPREYTASSLGN
jgi:hypothetical protein